MKCQKAHTHSLLAALLTLSLQAAPLELTNPSGEINDGTDGGPISEAIVPGWNAEQGSLHRSDTDYGNGAWCLAYEDSGSLYQLSTHLIEAGAAYSLRFDAALLEAPYSELVREHRLNGNFDTGWGWSEGDSWTFEETSNWTRLDSPTGIHADQTMEATRNAPANITLSGSRNASLKATPGERLFGLNTGYRLTGGETLHLSYQWVEAFNWDAANDQVAVSLFVTDNDQIGGTRTILETRHSSASQVVGDFQLEQASFSPIAAMHAGKQLYLLLEAVDGNGDNLGFARVDELELRVGDVLSGEQATMHVDFWVDDGGSRTVVATQQVDFLLHTEGDWQHYHAAIPAGSLDAHAGKAIGIQFRGADLASTYTQLIDHVALTAYPAGTPSGDFNSDWDSTADQAWAGPGFWANRLQDWSVSGNAIRNTQGKAYRTLHRVDRSIRGDGGNFQLSVETALDSGSLNAGARSGFLLGAGGRLDWRAALMVQEKPSRDFGLFLGIDGDGAALIADFGYNIPLTLAEGAEPAGGYPATARLELDANYQAASGSYNLTLSVYDGSSLISQANAAVPSSQVLGAPALLSHIGSGDARFRFDNFSGTGSLEAHSDRHLAVLSTLYTLDGTDLRILAQFPPLDLATAPQATLETWDGSSWNQLATATIDADPLSSYTARFHLAGWDSTSTQDYRVGIQLDSVDYYWEGTIQPDPVDRDTLILAGTSCQRLTDGKLDESDFEWTARKVWHPHAQLYEHMASHQPDLYIAHGDQLYEAQPTAPDTSSDSNRQLDYLYKWYLWLLQARELTSRMPSIVIPDDHDVYQGNLWGEGGIFTLNEDSGGYTQPASFVSMVERSMTGNLPTADPYNAVQPAPTVAQGIEVYFTKLTYGRLGMAILEDRKFKTGRSNPPVSWEQLLLGWRQHAFLDAFVEDWEGQDIKLMVSQSPLANLSTHSSSTHTFLIDNEDTNGWPVHRRNEAWEALRKGYLFQLSGDQHVATVAQHGIDGPRDAGYSFATPAVANFFARVFDPMHPSSGPASTVSPYIGDYYFDGNGTLPDGVTPNLSSSMPHHFSIEAVANSQKYYGLSNGRDPVNLHDQAVGYAITRIHKPTRQITFEAWPTHVDPSDARTGSQFADWPIQISQFDNEGRTPAGYLPVVETASDNPVITVIDEGSSETVYSVRIRGDHFQPPVYASGTTYTVEIREGDNSTPTEVRTAQAVDSNLTHAIDRFDATQLTLCNGESTRLRWSTRASGSLSIDQGVGEVTYLDASGNGYVEVSPTTTTTYTLTSTDSGGGNLQQAITITVQSPLECALASWTLGYGLSGNDTLAGANPDTDSLANLLEFYFNGNPTRSDDSLILPKLQLNGTHLLFRFRTSTVPLTHQVQYSDNLSDWQAASTLSGYLEVDAGTDTDGQPLREATIPLEGQSARFVRLHLSE